MEILGLIDALESIILDGFKIPLTKKTVVNEEKILAVVDKIRLVVQGGEDFAKKAISRGGGGEAEPVREKPEDRSREKARQSVTKLLERGDQSEEAEGRSIEVLQQAYQIAREVRQGADKYADEVLSNLEATSSRILRTVQAGRDRLKRFKGEGEAPPAPKDVAGKKKEEEKKG